MEMANSHLFKALSFSFDLIERKADGGSIMSNFNNHARFFKNCFSTSFASRPRKSHEEAAGCVGAICFVVINRVAGMKMGGVFG